ncbi:MAG: hypothetical protein UW13_C0019G0004 [candidate division WWE3 bacterium GW2011_GWA1_43_94]|nr:MAG: hypothetical protein UW13_C0019G0004 [candidate division WWE3 bacterium GW2011_GWA1_43_94]
MKLKPITLIALAVIVISGIWIYSQRQAAIKSAAPIPEQVQTTPTPEATPGRSLKQNEKFIAPVGLYVTVPEGMRFRQDIANDRFINFYIESGPEDEPTYQLYSLYQADNEMTEQGLEEATVGDYVGFEGLVIGPKTRYQVLVIKDGKPLSFSTWPPTEENKVITEQILSTISFE